MTAEAPAGPGGGRARRRVRARRSPLAALGIRLGLVAAAAIALLPFAFSLMTAFARDPDRRSPLAPSAPQPPDPFGAVPGDLADLAGAIRTTLAAVAVVTCAQVVSSVLAAYAFAQLRFPGREPLFRLFLVAMTIPTAALVVPLYLMAAGAGLRNTFWGVVVPFMLASPGAVLLLRESFRSVPRGEDRRGGPYAHPHADRPPGLETDPGRPDPHHRRQSVELLHVAAHYRQSAAQGRHRGRRRPAIPPQCGSDPHDGGRRRRPDPGRRPPPRPAQAGRRRRRPDRRREDRRRPDRRRSGNRRRPGSGGQAPRSRRR